jgi:hypothetical protein
MRLCIVVGLVACGLHEPDAVRAQPVEGACASLRGTHWVFGDGDGLDFRGETVTRRADEGQWQPGDGTCASGTSIMLTFGDERWRVVPMGSCAMLLHGPEHQRRELRLVDDRVCDGGGGVINGSRWELANGVALVLDLDRRATDLDERYGSWHLADGLVEVRWGRSAWWMAVDAECGAVVRRPEGDVQAVRRFPPCG